MASQECSTGQYASQMSASKGLKKKKTHEKTNVSYFH